MSFKIKEIQFNTSQSFWLYLSIDITKRYDAADNISNKICIVLSWDNLR